MTSCCQGGFKHVRRVVVFFFGNLVVVEEVLPMCVLYFLIELLIFQTLV